MRVKTSLLFLSLAVVALVFIPALHSRADKVTTRTETYSNSSQTASPPAAGYNCDLRESQRSTFPGVEDRKTTETCNGSDGNVPLTENEYQNKREQRESHISRFPDKKTVVKRHRSSDADVAPTTEGNYEYQYKSEHSESRQIAPPSQTVVEHDRTIVEHDVPAPPREGRLQSWWHRLIHRHTD